jgi:hypothetical protein
MTNAFRGKKSPTYLVILEDGIVIFWHTIQQRFPTFYVCDNKAENGM